jgi:hypothetical protein
VRPCLWKNQSKRAGGVIQKVEHLPSKCEKWDWMECCDCWSWWWRKEPWAKEWKWPLEAWRGKQISFPIEHPESKILILAHAGPFWTFSLQNCKIVSLYDLLCSLQRTRRLAVPRRPRPGDESLLPWHPPLGFSDAEADHRDHFLAVY